MSSIGGPIVVINRPCSNCELTTHPAFATHCCECGHILPASPARQQPSCHRCGAEFADGLYCCQCGWPLPADEVPPPSPEKTPEIFRQLTVQPLGGLSSPIICTHCQAFLHPESASHCCQCGHTLPHVAKPAFHAPCIACGAAELPAAAKFCSSCGWPLGKAPEPEEQLQKSAPASPSGMAHLPSTPRRPVSARPRPTTRRRRSLRKRTHPSNRDHHATN